MSQRFQVEPQGVESLRGCFDFSIALRISNALTLLYCGILCPEVDHAILRNSYSKPSALFVIMKKQLSTENKAQGDLVRMAMYGIEVLL